MSRKKIDEKQVLYNEYDSYTNALVYYLIMEKHEIDTLTPIKAAQTIRYLTERCRAAFEIAIKFWDHDENKDMAKKYLSKAEGDMQRIKNIFEIFPQLDARNYPENRFYRIKSKINKCINNGGKYNAPPYETATNSKIISDDSSESSSNQEETTYRTRGYKRKLGTEEPSSNKYVKDSDHFSLFAVKKVNGLEDITHAAPGLVK